MRHPERWRRAISALNSWNYIILLQVCLSCFYFHRNSCQVMQSLNSWQGTSWCPWKYPCDVRCVLINHLDLIVTQAKRNLLWTCPLNLSAAYVCFLWHALVMCVLIYLFYIPQRQSNRPLLANVLIQSTSKSINQCILC